MIDRVVAESSLSCYVKRRPPRTRVYWLGLSVRKAHFPTDSTRILLCKYLSGCYVIIRYYCKTNISLHNRIYVCRYYNVSIYAHYAVHMLFFAHIIINTNCLMPINLPQTRVYNNVRIVIIT